MGVSGPGGGAGTWVGVKGQRASALEPKRLPVHREAQHLQRRLERSVGCFSFLPDDAVAGRDVLASCCNTPAARSCAAPPRLINHLQVEDDPPPLDLPGFDSAVEDAYSLREGGDVQAGGEAARVGKRASQGIGAGQRAPGHAVATVNVFLQLVGGGKRIEFRRGCDGRGRRRG